MRNLPRTIQPKLPPSLALSSLYASATYNVSLTDPMSVISTCSSGTINILSHTHTPFLQLKTPHQKYLVEGDARLELLNSLQCLALLVAEDVTDLDAVGGLQCL